MPNLDEGALDALARLVNREVGLDAGPEGRDRFRRSVQDRMLALECPDVAAYARRLAGASPATDPEWQALLRKLTVGESYFFRDAGQFKVLRERVLPAVLARHASDRSIRIWSAGCSTGEEPYSVAMLLRELLPDVDDWDVLVVGTDVNASAIEQARRGTYADWSLRALKGRDPRRDFRRQGEFHEVAPEVKRMVRFRVGNLKRDVFPDPASDLHDFDVILCRNVFIYFDPESVRQVTEKFARTLRPGGFLLTGHLELGGKPVAGLRPVVTPHSVIHEKAEPAPRPPPARDAPAPWDELASTRRDPRAARPLPRGDAASPAARRLHAALAAYHRGDYDSARREAERLLELEPESAEGLRVLGVSRANAGDRAAAVEALERLVALRPLDVEAHYVLGKLAEDAGDAEEAARLFEKVIALAPSFVPAYYDLAWIRERGEDSGRATRLRAEALRLLARLTPSEIADACGGLTGEVAARQVASGGRVPLDRHAAGGGTR